MLASIFHRGDIKFVEMLGDKVEMGVEVSALAAVVVAAVLLHEHSVVHCRVALRLHLCNII